MFLDVLWCCNLCTKSFWTSEVPQKNVPFCFKFSCFGGSSFQSYVVLGAILSTGLLTWVHNAFGSNGLDLLFYYDSLCNFISAGKWSSLSRLKGNCKVGINIPSILILVWLFFESFLLSITNMILAFAWSRVHVRCLEAAFAFRLAQSHYWPKWLSYSFSHGALAFGCFKCLFGGLFFLTVSLTQYVGGISCWTSGHNLHTLEWLGPFWELH